MSKIILNLHKNLTGGDNMKHNAKENLKIALNELCSCQNHLNTAYLHCEDLNNRSEIHIALKTLGSAVDCAQSSLGRFKD